MFLSLQTLWIVANETISIFIDFDFHKYNSQIKYGYYNEKELYL